MDINKMKIAGDYDVSDWMNLKAKIIADEKNIDLWQKAFEFFYIRVHTRYLNPIKKILDMNLKNGEGFSAVSLHCALIEFLAAFHDGAIYKHDNPDTSKCEYCRSKDLFITFLKSVEPFKSTFTGKENDFYTNVRCGLLHEAAVKGNWKIKASHPNKVIETNSDETILFRNQLHKIICEYIENDYRNMLLKDNKIQKAFIRKMDSLCNP